MMSMSSRFITFLGAAWPVLAYLDNRRRSGPLVCADGGEQSTFPGFRACETGPIHSHV